MKLTMVCDFKNKEELLLFKDSINLKIQKKNALKFHLLSPMVGHISLAYERSITRGASLEFGISYIYGRYQYQKKETGGTARLGYKFINLKTYSKNSVQFIHILKGAYFKPEFIFSVFNSNYNFTNSLGLTENHSNDEFSYIIILNYGVQYIYDNAFLLDFYIGLGGGLSSETASFYYSNISIKTKPDDFCFSLTMGVKIGGLF